MDGTASIAAGGSPQSGGQARRPTLHALQPAGGRRVVVRDASGRPIAGVAVNVAGLTLAGQRFTDDTGRVTIPGAPLLSARGAGGRSVGPPFRAGKRV